MKKINIDFLINEAMKSPVNNKHSACCIVRNELYKESKAHNKYYDIKTNVKISVHAEIMALNKVIKYNKKGFDIIVIRLTKANKLTYSRPCAQCIETLKNNGFRKVYYSNFEGNIESEYLSDMVQYHTSARTKIKNNIN